MTAAMNSEKIGVKDLARWRGVSRWTAWRTLRRLEARYGDKVVWREGRDLFTSRAAYESVAEQERTALELRQERRILDLETWKADADTRIDALSREIIELRRDFQKKSHEHFRRRAAPANVK